MYFDRGSRPEDMFGPSGPKRPGSEGPQAGPAYRVVYRLLEAKRTDVRVVQVLGVGRALRAGEEDIYTTAARLLERLNWRNP